MSYIETMNQTARYYLAFYLKRKLVIFLFWFQSGGIDLSGDRLTAELNVKSSLPPIRHTGQDRSQRSISPYRAKTPDPETTGTREPLSTDNNLLSPLERSRTPRRRLGSHPESDDVLNGFKDNTKHTILPFVRCMVRLNHSHVHLYFAS